jgi:PPM family protein phosphatase
MIYVRSAALTHPGRKRPNNEDFVTFFEPIDDADLEKSGRIYILADGVGGASKGERASQYAAQKILFDYYQYPDVPIEKRLRMIIRRTGNEIFDYAESQPNFMRMATTVVVAIIYGDTLRIAHVGDSRAYLMRGDQVIQLTRDHSTVGEMTRDGILTEEEAMHFEGRNLLSRSLGGHRDVMVDVTDPIKFAPGDKLLLVSDGFSRYATRETISGLLNQGPPDEVVYRLIDYANQQGGVDNISVILVEGLSERDVEAGQTGGQKPEPVNWESIPTEHSAYAYGKTVRTTPKKKRQFIIIGAAVLLLFIAGILFTGKIIKTLFSQEAAATPTMTIPIMGIVPVDGGQQPTQEFLSPTVTFTPQADLTMLTPTLTLESDGSDNVSPPMPTTQPGIPGPHTVTPTDHPDYPPDTLGDCEYTILPEHLFDPDIGPHESIRLILKNHFHKDYDYDSEQFKNYVATIKSIKGDYVDPRVYIQPEWILLLPDITYIDCKNAEGDFTPYD